MSQVSFQSQAPRRGDDALTLSLERLHQALAADVPAHEREWAVTVEDALARLEKALRQHMAVAEAPDGLFAEVDDTRPTLARQTDELCSHHGDLLKQLLGLREQVQEAAEAFAPAHELSAGTNAAGVPDFGALRQQGEQLLAGLQQTKDAETRLILESVNTDIGEGD